MVSPLARPLSGAVPTAPYPSARRPFEAGFKAGRGHAQLPPESLGMAEAASVITWSTTDSHDSSRKETSQRSQPVWRNPLPSWFPWFLQRLASGLGVVLLISLIVFAATQALPSDPARIILGSDASEATVNVLRTQLGLNDPVWQQYGHWLKEIVSGNLGRSIDSNVPVAALLSMRFANTMILALCVTVLSVPLALLLGILAAMRRDSLLDRTALSLLILFKAIPGFVIALLLVMLLSTSVFKILPAASLLNPQLPFTAQLQYLVLPTLTLALSITPYLFRLVRASMIETLESEYVTAARLRGIPERRIVWLHVVPNALIPALQGIATSFRILIGGAVLAEVVFNYPGIGSTLEQAIHMRDIPLIQSIVLVLTVGIVGINLLADLLTVLLTPRLRTSSQISSAALGRTGRRYGFIRNKAGSKT